VAWLTSTNFPGKLKAEIIFRALNRFARDFAGLRFREITA
jgi:hypothetical protein